MPLELKIGPSVLAADLSNLFAESQDLLKSGADYLHLDVMDGHFVPNISFGHPVIKCLRKNIPKVQFEAHMMVSEPLKWLKPVADAGADIYTFHIETVDDLETVIRRISETGMKVGVALKPDTLYDHEKFHKLLDEIDRILVMTVEPGFGGQSFIEKCLTKVEEIRSFDANINIEVDGGVNFETIVNCSRSGANLFVVGTALTSLEDRKLGTDRLRVLAQDHFKH